MESVSPAWNPHLQKDIAELDKRSHRVERLCDPRITFEALSQRRLRADMCETYKIPHHEYRLDSDKFFTLSDDPLATASSYQDSGVVRIYTKELLLIEWSTRGKTVTANNLSTFKERLGLGADERALNNQSKIQVS